MKVYVPEPLSTETLDSMAPNLHIVEQQMFDVEDRMKSESCYTRLQH